MGNLRAYFGTVLALTAAACGGDSDAKPDGPVVVIPDASIDAQAPDAPVDAAPMFDFSCANNPAPTTAPNPLTVSGTVTDIDLASQEAEPVAMALVTARQSSNNAPIGTPQTTPADGSFTISAPSGGMPIDGYVEASKTGHRTVRVYPPAPLSADFTGVPALLLSNATFNFVVQFAGAQQDADKGTVALVALDCAGSPIGGATISVTQNGQEVGTQYDASQLQPGAFIIFNVPAGETTVSATYDGMMLRSHVVASVAQTLSSTVVRPGF